MNVISQEPIEECQLPELIATIHASLAPATSLPDYQAENDVDDDEMEKLIDDLKINDLPQRIVTFEGLRRVLGSSHALLVG